MLYLEDLKYMKLYKKKFYLPIDRKDKRHGSVIMLLSPNYETSLKLMNNQFGVNHNRSFEGYYIEKDITYTINHESRNLEVDHLDYTNIINEQPSIFTETTDIKDFDPLDTIDINEVYCKLGDKLIFFNEMYDDSILEATNYNARYRTLLYNDRMRNNKEVFRLYDQVKQDNKWIKRTFVRLDRYRQYNIFVDLYYYYQIFMKNNTFTPIRTMPIYTEFIRRFLMDKRIEKAGYKTKTIFVPINGWGKKEGSNLYDYLKNINPISMMYRFIKLDPAGFKQFENLEFVLFGNNGYFKCNTDTIVNATVSDRNKFIRLITKLESNDPVTEDDDEPDSSPDGITTSILNKLETNSGIVVHSLTGSADTEAKVLTKPSTTVTHPPVTKQQQIKVAKKDSPTAKEKQQEIKTVVKEDRPKQAKAAENNIEKENMKKVMVDKIQAAAKDSKDEDETLDKLETDKEFKQILQDLQSEADDNIKLSAARSARITQNQDNLMKKQINGKTVKEMVNESNKPKELPETDIPIKTINDEWHHLKAVNFEKEYDLDADIVKCLNSLSDSNKTYPISILDIQVEDTSTSEDSVYTYTVKCEDYDGKRSTLKFDIPKLRDNRFMRLRGNEKIFSIELPLIPISKTDTDSVQICSFYNKIFVETYYNSVGKSNPFAGMVIKSIEKYDGKNITHTDGDNTRISTKYELPIDYIDLGSQYSTIEVKREMFKDTLTIYFNQDAIRSFKEVDPNKGLPVAITNNGLVMYYDDKVAESGETVSEYIGNLIAESDEKFAEIYYNQKPGRKFTYSRAHILNTDIPVIVILAHDLGLTKAMDLAKIDYDITEKRVSNQLPNKDVIKLADGYIYYTENYQSMMLMNGLKDCPMETVSVKDLNAKMTWVDMLENFGGRIKSDGLDNCKELMYDPITVEVSRQYQLPDNYHEALIYASNLLVDNKFTNHTDLSTNRYRTNEVIAAHFYVCLSTAYREYSMQQRRGRKVAISMKQSAVIDHILAQNTTSDLSVFQPLYEIETKNTISTKGVTGMNSERAYKMEKRGYDDSMVNVIAQATGFASTVGVNRTTSINPNIEGGRGYIKQSGVDNMSVTNTLSMTEALEPFEITSNDTFRNNMGYIQSAKHTTPIEYGSPLLVTTGADAAMPYLSSDMFCHKAKQPGEVTELTDKYMMITYKDGTKEYINLDEQSMKNSDGGFYITLQLKTDLKVGSKVKEGQILAYDKKSFSDKVGSGQVSYNLGCLTKAAVMTTEDGFADAGVCSEWLSEAMASDIVVMKSVTLDPKTNIISMVEKGASITEGEPILIFQNAFDEDDANLLLKQLNNEDGDVVEIGRSVIKSKVTGVLSDIKIYRTCDMDELSESLQKIVKKYNSEVNALRKVASQANNDVELPSTEKLPQTGKMKNTNGIMIEFYMRYHDKLAVGDKYVCNLANKNIIMDMYSVEDSPYTDYRPTEQIDVITSASSLDGRMITSTIKIGALNKVMIELTRQLQEIYGIKWPTMHEIYDEDMSHR